MSRGERNVAVLWLVVSLLAATAMFGQVAVAEWAPRFALLTSPFGLVHWVPTLWLYLTAGLLIRALLGVGLRRWRFSGPVLAGFASALTLGLGILVPTLANREMERRVSASLNGDFGEPPMLAPVDAAAYLEQPLRYPEHGCSSDCQRLLFSGWARSYVRGSAALLRHSGRPAPPLIRHEIVPISQGCDHSRLDAPAAPAARTPAAAAGAATPLPYPWNKLADLRREGRCFRSVATSGAAADIYFIRIWGPPRRGDGPYYDFRLLTPIRFHERRIIRVRRQGRLAPLMRRTLLSYDRLATPLQITPPALLMPPRRGGWARRSETVGEPLPPRFHAWLANDLWVDELDGQQLRP